MKLKSYTNTYELNGGLPCEFPGWGSKCPTQACW